MASSEKISVYSLADLKNTTDDTLPVYLNSLKFTQSHSLLYTRLALGYSAFAICCATFWWDYTYGFFPTKFYTSIAVALYFLLNSILTFWIFYVEAGTIYVGTSPAGDLIKIQSKTQKHVPIYNLTVTTHWKGASGPEVKKLKLPFTKWFDREGRLAVRPFQELVASNVPLVGSMDPERVVEEKKKKVDRPKGEAEKSMEDKWASLLAESSGAAMEGTSTGNGTPSGKAKKRTKKTA